MYTYMSFKGDLHLVLEKEIMTHEEKYNTEYYEARAEFLKLLYPQLALRS